MRTSCAIFASTAAGISVLAWVIPLQAQVPYEMLVVTTSEDIAEHFRENLNTLEKRKNTI